jgi:5-methyltetrahydrofolate--homocysteine methyltransferase
MTTAHEGLERELQYITRPFEVKHIRSLFEGTDPLMHEIAFSLIKGDQHAVDRLTQQALSDGFSANTVLDEGLVSGMAVVGIKFRDNIIFVPEVLISARAMKAGMVYIEPILSASGIEPLGTIIMGTVKGDLHDIGKNLCIMMLRGSGFVVHDLGVDTKPDEFMQAVEEHDANVLGMSALLTTTMPNMGRTIRAFEDQGMRESVKIMVGGAPVTQEFAEDMGADGYGENAIACVDMAKELLGVGLDGTAPTNAAEVPQPTQD